MSNITTNIADMDKPKDTIFHTTTTKPKFRDRLKILLGASIIVGSEIYVNEIVTPIYSKATDRVEFESKNKEL